LLAKSSHLLQTYLPNCFIAKQDVVTAVDWHELCPQDACSKFACRIERNSWMPTSQRRLVMDKRGSFVADIFDMCINVVSLPLRRTLQWAWAFSALH
jgi:hypothetical protein